MKEILIEAAVDSVEAAVAAVEAGAGRIELCADLDVGGLTPSAELMAEVRRRVEVPVFPMIRVRAGSFVYTAEAMEVMRGQLREMAGLGADGFVFGALTADLRVDQTATAEIVKEAGEFPVTFHRAFDRTPDLASSLEALMGLGVARVLTSGGKERAAQGMSALAGLVRQADGRIGILAGGGVSWTNICEVVEVTGVAEVHARCYRDGARVSGIRAALDNS
jgi:copper homeostasis protein